MRKTPDGRLWATAVGPHQTQASANSEAKLNRRHQAAAYGFRPASRSPPPAPRRASRSSLPGPGPGHPPPARPRYLRGGGRAGGAAAHPARRPGCPRGAGRPAPPPCPGVSSAPRPGTGEGVPAAPGPLPAPPSPREPRGRSGAPASAPPPPPPLPPGRLGCGCQRVRGQWRGSGCRCPQSRGLRRAAAIAAAVCFHPLRAGGGAWVSATALSTRSRRRRSPPTRAAPVQQGGEPGPREEGQPPPPAPAGSPPCCGESAAGERGEPRRGGRNGAARRGGWAGGQRGLVGGGRGPVRAGSAGARGGVLAAAWLRCPSARRGVRPGQGPPGPCRSPDGSGAGAGRPAVRVSLSAIPGVDAAGSAVTGDGPRAPGSGCCGAPAPSSSRRVNSSQRQGPGARRGWGVVSSAVTPPHPASAPCL